MRTLPIVELSPDRLIQSRLAPWVHAVRVALIFLVLVGLNRWAKSYSASSSRSAAANLELDAIQSVFPDAISLETLDDDANVARVMSSQGQSLGFVAMTSPHADRIVGYAGPSNVMIVMDDQRKVIATRLLHCPDTHEHLRKVQSSRAFWNQFLQWKWGETSAVKVDGVSGATLTSLAVAESVAWRMATTQSLSDPQPVIRRSLRFSDEINAGSLRKWFPDIATSVTKHDVFQLTVVDANSNAIGTVIRTSPLSDSIIGYQGPTELILRVSDAGVVSDLMLGESFDNQPYVNYVKQEASFWRKFKNRTIESLAAMDLDQEQIDGVSGATMTSIAVAETIREASRTLLDHREQQQKSEVDQAEAVASGAQRSLRWNGSLTELITAAFAIAALAWSRSRLRGRRTSRILWQVSALILLGLVCGNILSVALLGGWTRGGIAWRLAPGLATLVMVSVLGAAVTKRNIYCDHLCSHGIIQQWIRPKRGRRIWPWLEWTLRLSALMVIGITIAGVLVPLTTNLAWFEPFDAYVVRVGVSFSLVVWALSLLLARYKPMAYCRLACPTGKLLNYVRRDAASHRISGADLILIVSAGTLWIV
jgi:NosR/NirI family transcriptional regulator, nitrous oxide reductase regulator